MLAKFSKFSKLSLLSVVASVAVNATEVMPPKKIVHGDISFIVSKEWEILYYKVNKKDIFNVLSCVRGQPDKQRVELISGKVLSQKCSQEVESFSMQRRVSLEDDKIEADLQIDINKEGKIDFKLKLDYKADVVWTANHKRMYNLMIMKTSAPVMFRAISAEDKELNGSTEGKIDHFYLKELIIETDVGPLKIKAENESTSIRFSSPESMGGEFEGAYIMAGLFSFKDKGRLVSFKDGDSEEMKFSITSYKQEKENK